jgi:hypothetical protein
MDECEIKTEQVDTVIPEKIIVKEPALRTRKIDWNKRVRPKTAGGVWGYAPYLIFFYIRFQSHTNVHYMFAQEKSLKKQKFSDLKFIHYCIISFGPRCSTHLTTSATSGLPNIYFR